MNRILLTSTALVAFAGAAAAEVSFSGDAELGYNDKVKNGFYWDANVKVKAEQELNGGLTAGFTGKINVAGTGNLGNPAVSITGYELYLKSDTAGMYFGDTNGAARAVFGKTAGVSGMVVGKFDKKPTGADGNLRGEAKMFGGEVAVSAGVRRDGRVFGYQAAAAYEVGNYKVAAAYQHAPFGQSKMVAGRVETSFAGADVKFAAARMAGNYSVGAEVSYPVGPVTATGYYAYNKVGADIYGVKLAYANGPIEATAYYKGARPVSHTVGLDASYKMGNGLVLKAGGEYAVTAKTQSAYVGAEYDLGNDAKLMASYGYDNVVGAATKKIGDPEYMEGATVAVSFEF